MRTLTDHIVSGDQAVQLEIQVMDEPGAGGANHRYDITIPGRDSGVEIPNTPLSTKWVIKFQNGPIKEAGVNGITNEALYAICADRLRGFQSGEYACADNEEALMHTMKALECLQRRTVARIKRGVEGTMEK